jgi:RimJ/RimL family protein N-acetyltransferase
MAKVKAKADAGKKKPVKAARGGRVEARQKPLRAAAGRRSMEKKANPPPARRSAGKAAAKKAAPARKVTARVTAKKLTAGKAAAPRKAPPARQGKPRAAHKPVAKATAATSKTTARKALPPTRSRAAAKRGPATGKASARTRTMPAAKAPPRKKAAAASRRPAPRPTGGGAKTPLKREKIARPVARAESPRAVIPLKKPAPPAAARKRPARKVPSVPASGAAILAAARTLPPPPPPLPPSPLLQPEGGIPAIPLRRPQVETPSATAMSLAAATARLSARRVRDLLPVRIQTRRLALRAPIRGDVPELVKLADNRNIADRLPNFPSPYTRADGIGFVEIYSQRPDERPYAITLEGVFIGIIGISFPPQQPPTLGIWVGEAHWGQGYAQEALRGVIDAAHQTREFPVIRAEVLSDNAVSLHILEKMGFKQAGKRKETQGRFKDRTIILLELEQPRWTLV